MIDLSGKTALICGASQGIGQATAIQMSELGANVIILARSEQKLHHTLTLLKQTGNHTAIAADLGDRKMIAEKVGGVLKKTGPIEILICNSGGPKGGPLTEADEAEFISGFSNHVLANALLVKLLLPGMESLKTGRIINIISTSVKIPIVNLGVSNVIRGAVASWAKTLSLELASTGITVNNVLPGYTETPRLAALISGAAKKRAVDEKVIVSEWQNKVPSQRFARPEEVASAISFLASPAASYINGINLPVDGGRTGTL